MDQSTEVFEGDDGHLFLVGGSNSVSDFFLGSDDSHRALCLAWKNLLRDRDKTAASKGARYLHCFVPDKLSVLRDRASSITTFMRFPAQTLEEDDEPDLRRVLVPLTGFLRKQAQRYPIFHKTDTHWTIEGCFSAYQMLCSRMGLRQKEDLILRGSSAIENSWDLGSKVKPKRLETIRFGRFGLGTTRVYANEIVTARESGKLTNHLSLHVGSMVEYHNSASTAARIRLIVFGDSFFEYRPHMLTGMFAETVENILFVWSSSIDWKLVEDFKPNFILTEIAERFMRTLPTDDVDIRDHAAKKVAAAFKRP
ncbi:alginate O-acetyltransferase AlgX-related protein [Bradyrhizobium symbiodeficiens]|uniref:alginate O-acetyltransferase AlgX-related protein n=1 Tax=Bradyrhizobium symbiodeficiens TaxID=1404367 RepID=UPI00140F5216|nr:hypothetical protein [Bradyrhizobium symbiodeficiens]QIO98810.1 hypothetical protein HAU86_02845 [Bradyrhizobium symbiodeficiens]